MTFVEELRQIYLDSKPLRKELEEEFEQEQRELAEKFMYEFLFPRIKEEYQKTPWVKQFPIEVTFCDGVWVVRNGLIPLGKTSDYPYHIGSYIDIIAHEEGVKHTERFRNEKDEFCVLLKFILK